MIANVTSAILVVREQGCVSFQECKDFKHVRLDLTDSKRESNTIEREGASNVVRR